MKNLTLESHMKNVTLQFLRGNEGVTAIVVAIVLVLLLSFAALAIDIGNNMVARNELQNVADAAALAGTRQLGLIYEGMSHEEQAAYVLTLDDEAKIKDAAMNVALANITEGAATSLRSEDIIVGRWMFSSWVPTPNPHPSAVRVYARKDDLANGPVSTFFAGVMGISSMNVSQMATAALTGVSEIGPWGLPIPVGLSCSWVETASCGDEITFYPTGTSCAGWNTYTSWPSNASKLRNILDSGSTNLLACATGGITDPSCFQTPETTAGVTQFVFTGGTVASAFPDMEALFNGMRVLNDGVLDKDTNSNTWTTSVPVYAQPDGTCIPCGAGMSNPSGYKLIVGFATITMTEVMGVSSKELRGQLVCNTVVDAPGGGSPYGTEGSIPNLVQ